MLTDEYLNNFESENKTWKNRKSIYEWRSGSSWIFYSKWVLVFFFFCRKSYFCLRRWLRFQIMAACGCIPLVTEPKINMFLYCFLLKYFQMKFLCKRINQRNKWKFIEEEDKVKKRKRRNIRWNQISCYNPTSNSSSEWDEILMRCNVRNRNGFRWHMILNCTRTVRIWKRMWMAIGDEWNTFFSFHLTNAIVLHLKFSGYMLVRKTLCL